MHIFRNSGSSVQPTASYRTGRYSRTDQSGPTEFYV